MKVDIEKLRALIEASGRAASAISTDAGLGRTAIKDILRGKSLDPGIGTLFAIAGVLGCDITAMISQSEADNRRSLIQRLSPNWHHMPIVEAVEPSGPGKTGNQPSDRALSFKAWMGRMGTNTRQVSNKSGVSYTTLASFVQGQTQSLRGDTEEMITAAYGQSVATIFEGDLGADNDENRLIGLKIRSARRALGMNQADLGAALGVAQNTVSDMEAGKLSSWRIHIGKISAILNQPRSYFEADWVPAEPSRPKVPMTEAETVNALKAEVVRLSRTVERLEADIIRLAGMVALQSSTFPR